jgi:hypothetical protein
MFLELPAEIRVIIYEEAIEHFAADHGYCPRINVTAPSSTQAFALTQVNRLMRKETIPLLSKWVLFQIHANTDESRARGRSWLQSVDEEILEGRFRHPILPMGPLLYHLHHPVG